MSRGWSWYDRRDGKRTTNATFLSYQSAQEQLDDWMGRYEEVRDRRPDLADLLGHVEVREIE